MNNLWKRILCTVLALVIVILPTCNVRAAALSGKEKNYYSKVLKNKQYVEDTSHSIYDGGSFLLYDINHDGRKELIVGGPLGLRCAEFSIIYFFDGKRFHKSETINGAISGVSSKGIEFTYEDYAQAGMIRYFDKSTYSFGKDGKLTLKLQEYREEETDINTLKTKVTEHTYSKFVSGKATRIKKNSYVSARKKYSLKTAGENYSYEENGKTVSKTFKVQTHLITAQNIKKYIK